MNSAPKGSVEKRFLILLLALLPWLFFYSPGTGDVRLWMRWINQIDQSGLIRGFADIQADYPPYCLFILWLSRAFRHFHLSSFLALKAMLLIFLYLSSAVFWRLSRDFVWTSTLFCTLLFSSVAMGYLDIFFVPQLLVAFWALKERRLALFSVSFTFCCLTKWQPMIIAPFFLIHCLLHFPLKTVLREAAAPAALILVVTIAVFQPEPFIAAFFKALHHDGLSAYGLNFNWIVSYFLQATHPEQYGSIVHGVSDIVVGQPMWVNVLAKSLFFATYLGTLLFFVSSRRSFADLLKYSLIGYLAYFTFNTGVHENHLFLTPVVAIALAREEREMAPVAVAWALMSSLNLFVFYGIDGGHMTYSHALGERLDLALVLSIFNTGFFVYLWSSSARALPQIELTRIAYRLKSIR